MLHRALTRSNLVVLVLCDLLSLVGLSQGHLVLHLHLHLLLLLHSHGRLIVDKLLVHWCRVQGDHLRHVALLLMMQHLLLERHLSYLYTVQQLIELLLRLLMLLNLRCHLVLILSLKL